MAAKPQDIDNPTQHLRWDRSKPFKCPSCGGDIMHLYNDGGRRVETMKGSFWVVTNFYRCLDPKCPLNERFSPVQESVLKRKKHNVDVWAKVIQHHFKHKMDYTTISEVMWDDWEISISAGTVQSICESFELAAIPTVTKEAKETMKKQGYIKLSLDGAQPEKGRPGFWMFSDIVSNSQLHAEFLKPANKEKLAGIYKLIEKEYGVPIKGFISDKQDNIVKSVRLFNPTIPHAYCQYHFLGHVAEPIAAKDSYLLKNLRSAVREFSLVKNHVATDIEPVEACCKVNDIFAPVVEELLCAIATKGNYFKTFPGMETFANLEHVLNKLKPFSTRVVDKKVNRSLDTLVSSIGDLLDEYKGLYEEIVVMLMDFNQLRATLFHRKWNGKRVKKSVDKWVYKLQCRLRRRDLEYRPGAIKWAGSTMDTKITEAWQQWIRLVGSYEDGLYVSYDDVDLTATNNKKESEIHQIKYQFKKWLGRNKISGIFEKHATNYIKLMNFDMSKENILDVLLAMEIPLINDQRKEMRAIYATTRRFWRVREHDTGNFSKFKTNLALLKA
jgi:hypothetical protein